MQIVSIKTLGRRSEVTKYWPGHTHSALKLNRLSEIATLIISLDFRPHIYMFHHMIRMQMYQTAQIFAAVAGTTYASCGTLFF